MHIYECRYVSRQDHGDLLGGFRWRPAVLVLDNEYEYSTRYTHEYLESRMFDKETGKPVGDTRNYCVCPFCTHEDCAPLTLIYKD